MDICLCASPIANKYSTRMFPWTRDFTCQHISTSFISIQQFQWGSVTTSAVPLSGMQLCLISARLGATTEPISTSWRLKKIHLSFFHSDPSRVAVMCWNVICAGLCAAVQRMLLMSFQERWGACYADQAFGHPPAGQRENLHVIKAIHRLKRN